MRPEDVHVRFLGGAVIERDGEPLAGPAAQRHPLALLAILAIEGPAPVTRDKLVALLWPEAGAAEARKRLRAALHTLREALGADAVSSVGDALLLVPDHAGIDVRDFEAAIAAGDLEAALRSYGGPFLDGFHLPSSAEFGEWADRHRARLARACDGALERLAGSAEDRGRWRRASELWRERAARDRFSGRVAMRLMTALERAGERAAALRHGERFAARLKKELGMGPAAELTALLDRIRHDPLPVGAGRGPEMDPGAGDRASPRHAAPGGAPTRRRQRPAIRSPLAAAIAIAVGFVLVAAVVRTVATVGPPSAASEGVPPLGFVLADFREVAGDPSHARAVTEALRSDLALSATARLARPAEIREALALMRRPPGTPLDAETAREVAARLGYPAAIEGEVVRAGSGYIVHARIVTPDSGRVLEGFRETASDSTGLLDAIERLSHRLRRRAGETLEEVEASPPLARVTTHSLPALRKWAHARNASNFHDPDVEEIIGWLEEAVELDPEFAAAWHWLAITHVNANHRVAALRASQQAVAATDRLPPGQRPLSRIVHAQIKGDFATAEAELLSMRPPRWAAAVHGAWMQGDFRKAEQYSMRALEAARERGESLGWVAYWNLTMAQLDQGKLGAARATAEASSASGNPAIAENLHWMVDFSEGRHDLAARRRTSRELRKPQRMALLHGRLAEARSAAEEWAAKYPVPQQAVLAVEHAIADFLLLGRAAPLLEVDSIVRYALPRRFDEQLLAEIAAIQALAGNVAAATATRSVYERRVPPEVRWNDTHLLILAEGLMAFHEGRPDAALAAFRRARASTPWAAPVDALLGRAYDRFQRPDSAIAAYTRYLEGPWSYRAGPAGSLTDPLLLVPTHERLALLYADQGDIRRARTHAARVVELWAEADPELRPRVIAMRRLLREGRPAALR